MIGDPKEVQKIHVLKYAMSGRNNKICQKCFWLLLLPPFLPIRMVCSENKEWTVVKLSTHVQLSSLKLSTGQLSSQHWKIVFTSTGKIVFTKK